MPSDVGQRLPWAFPLSPHYWRQRWHQTAAHVAAANERRRHRGTRGTGLLSNAAPSASSLSSRDGAPAVRIEGLRKVFRTTDGMEKVGPLAGWGLGGRLVGGWPGVRVGLRAGVRRLSSPSGGVPGWWTLLQEARPADRAAVKPCYRGPTC